jgi:uncharacterized coiled-coil protein SlyX
MKSASVVIGLGVAGLVGGFAAAMLRQSAAPPPQTRASRVELPSGSITPDSQPIGLRDLEARIASLEAALAEANREIIALRGATDARAASDSELEARLSEAERRVSTREPKIFEFGDASTTGEKATVETLAARAAELSASMERIRNHRALAGLNEEDRWTKARDEVGLSAQQEETLKEAIATYRNDLRAALEDKEVTNRDGTASVRLRIPDPEKARDARRAYADRTAGLLSEDQATKWNDKGFAGTLGAPTGDTTTTQVIVESR